MTIILLAALIATSASAPATKTLTLTLSGAKGNACKIRLQEPPPPPTVRARSSVVACSRSALQRKRRQHAASFHSQADGAQRPLLRERDFHPEFFVGSEARWIGYVLRDEVGERLLKDHDAVV